MTFEPKIVGLLCNWCSYAGADLAGTSRRKYAPNVRVVRVMCSGGLTPPLFYRLSRRGRTAYWSAADIPANVITRMVIRKPHGEYRY